MSPTPDTPRVSGRLHVDLSDIDWRTSNSWSVVAERFSYVSDAPAGAEIVVTLPSNGRWLPLTSVFRCWDETPARLIWTIQGGGADQVRRAVAEIRQQIDGWAAAQPRPWTGEWPDDTLGATG